MAKTIRYIENGETLSETVLGRGLGDLAENQLGELPPSNALDDTTPTGEYSIDGTTTNRGNLDNLGITGDSVVHVIEHQNGGYSNIGMSVGTGTPLLVFRHGDGLGTYSDWTGVVDTTNAQTIGGVKTFSDNVIMQGDLTVQGTTTTVNQQEVTTEDNIITLNNGEAGAGVTSGFAGVVIDRGTLPNYEFVFNETNDSFEIGKVNDRQKVATREDTPIDQGLAYWDTTQNRFLTSSTTSASNVATQSFSTSQSIAFSIALG